MIYCSWHMCLKQCLPLQRKIRRLCLTVLGTQDFLARRILPRSRSQFTEKKGKEIFSKIVRARKLTRQITLELNNAQFDSTAAAVDSIYCKKQQKTVSFTMSWQEEVGLHHIVYPLSWLDISGGCKHSHVLLQRSDDFKPFPYLRASIKHPWM